MSEYWNSTNNTVRSKHPDTAYFAWICQTGQADATASCVQALLNAAHSSSNDSGGNQGQQGNGEQQTATMTVKERLSGVGEGINGRDNDNNNNNNNSLTNNNN